MPPEFFRPAGPERRSRPEFEQRLYQTAISAKLSAEWQAGPGISPRKAGCKVLFCQKRRGDQAAEGGGFFEERQTDGTAAERHGKQLPQTRRPGFRGYKSRDPDRTAAERGAARRRGTDKGDGVRATQQAMNSGRQVTGNGQQGIDNGQQGIDNGRRTTSGGRWTMNGKTRNDRRKTRRNTDDGGRTDKAGEMRAERNTDRGRNGQREMRAGKRKTEDGKKDGAKSDAAKTDRTAESGGKKKQACATAGPTTRPEGRHTIFISARPEYASQRRESSYRPA